MIKILLFTLLIFLLYVGARTAVSFVRGGKTKQEITHYLCDLLWIFAVVCVLKLTGILA